ncbi:hypothetical protein SAMN04488544_2810 [Microlunatus sagamiharensis]|uniref:Camelysin metallo-endopeptidase n=1 Tax=Microlunatus sagamiharensis TaxID=546874 RepID=A0A1H2MW43_9ACTN|nr:hypothetical protein [Microlunatus sagamiharensis]SDU97282.1 hypothetical protein SAMN04488544_2810 [Microlunatus sagamiharensis]
MNTTSATSARRPSRKVATIVSLIAVPVALAASGLVVAQSSYSAYSATTANPTSNWATGTVALSDDDNNTAAFTASNLKPGSTGSRCIVVSSTGSLPSAVKLYGTGAATTKALASDINLTITQGTGGSFGDCTGYTPLPKNSAVYSGTLAGFSSAATNFSNGLGAWNTTGAGTVANPETRTYQLTYSVRTETTNDTQGGTAAVGFTWEAQNS